MITILEKLIDLVQAWISYLLPWYVLGDDMLGLVRRVGVYHRDLTPGLNWKIPILEEPRDCSRAIESSILRVQTITTSDGHAVSLSGVVGWHVVDARKYILECGDPASVLNDIGCGVIGRVGPRLSLVDLMGPEAPKECLRLTRRRALKWGIQIDSFSFSDRTRARVLHVLGPWAPGAVL